MTPGRYTLGGLDMPPDAIITSGDSITLQRSLVRAVDSDVWETQGDGRPVPAPLVIEFTIEGTSEADASAQAALWWQLAQSAPGLTRETDGRTRALLGAQSIVAQHVAGDGKDQRITLTLLPASGSWGNGGPF